MNLNPQVWGPRAWFFIDSIVLSLPDKLSYEQKNIYKNFLTSLQDILPCEGCRKHYKQNLIKFPLTDEVLSKKENMIKWVLNVHNNKQYDNDNDKNKKNCNFKYYISIIIILILLIFIFYKFKS